MSSWIPSLVIGILNPLVTLEQRGHVRLRLQFGFQGTLAKHAIDWCDVAVFSRGCEPAALQWLYLAKFLGKRVIYEIDDNFEEIPLNTPMGFYHRAFYRLHVGRRFYALADVTRVYSRPIRHRAECHGARVRLERSYFDRSIISGLKLPRKTHVTRIAYPSGRLDDPRLERMLYGALRQVMLRHPGQVELHLWRKCPPALFGVPGVVVHQTERRYRKFVRTFYALGCHIGLAPVLDEPFFHSKTNNKYRELGGAGVAGIYSRAIPYTDSVTDGETGLLVDNTIEAWTAGITRLIGDTALRDKITTQARQDVFAHYTFEDAVTSFQTAIDDCFKVPFQACDWIYDAKDTIIEAALITSAQPARVDIDGQQQDRAALFAKAVAALGGEVIACMDAQALRPRPDVAQRSNLVLFLIDRAEDLVAAIDLLAWCNSAIFDVTQLDMTPADFRDSLTREDIPCPLSLVITLTQSGLRAVGHDLALPCLDVTPRVSALEVEYSLASYPAAYLDGIERHIRFGTQRRQTRFRAAIEYPLQAVLLRFGAYRNRLKQAWYCLCWRLGQRPL